MNTTLKGLPSRARPAQTATYRAALALAALAIVSLAIYGLAFVRPYSLLTWCCGSFITIEKISHNSLLAVGGYVFSLAELFFLYTLALRVAKGRHGPLAWAVVIMGAAAFSAAMVGMYPVDSTDIFDYIIRGRMLALYHTNTYYHVPLEFRHDPLFPYVSWVGVPTAYGPLWEMIATIPARLAGNSPLANVLAFKALAVLAYAGIVAVIGRMLWCVAPERALFGVTLFAWNPAVIYLTAGGGHNDVVMVFFMVLGFYWLARGHFTLAALAQVVGALIKYIPALVFPVVIVAALTRLKSWRARVAYLLVTGGACLLLVIAAWLPFYRGGDILGVSRREKLYTTSLPTLVRLTLQPTLHDPQAGQVTNRVAIGVLGIFVLSQLVLTWKSKDEDTPVRSGLGILIFYLLVSNPWFWPWYLIWPLSLAALLPDGVLSRGAILFSLAATWKEPTAFLLNLRGPRPSVWYEWRQTLDVMAVPWAYFIVQGIRARLHLPVRARSKQPEAVESEPAPTFRRIGT